MKAAPPSTKPDILLHYPQQVIIFKSLKRFERLKLDYSGLYRANLSRKDSLQWYRAQLRDSSIAITQGKENLKAANYKGWVFAQNAERWKHKARARNVRSAVIFSLIIAAFTYERIH